MTCDECPTIRKELSTAQKECNFWKNRYYIEKKCRNSLINFILGVFGFTVKVEFEKESNGIKIEGKENKEAISQAAIPTTGNNENKVMMMEDKVNPEDFLEDSEELSSLALVLTDNIQETSPVILSKSESEFGQDQETVLNANQQQQQPLEISGGVVDSHDAQAIWDLLKNYNENSPGQIQQQPAFIILKSADGTESLMDYSQLGNGDARRNAVVLTDNNNQVVYRLGGSPPLAAPNLVLAQTPTQTPISTASPQTTGKTTKPQRPSAQSKKMKLQVTGSLSAAAGSENKTVDKFSIEFGLTLREKAEVYVQTKAMEAIKKLNQGFICSECSNDYVFSSIENALMHTKTHYERTPYKCQYCEDVFSIQKEFLQHRKSHQHNKKGSAISLVKHSPATALKQTAFLSPRNSNTPISVPSTSEGNMISQTTTNPNSKQFFGQPSPANKSKQFKCQIQGCEWSYGTENELGWHTKAHLQSRV